MRTHTHGTPYNRTVCAHTRTVHLIMYAVKTQKEVYLLPGTVPVHVITFYTSLFEVLPVYPVVHIHVTQYMQKNMMLFLSFSKKFFIHSIPAISLIHHIKVH
jgi:hypothetical protein